MNVDQITQQHVLDWIDYHGLGPTDMGRREIQMAAESILGHHTSRTAELRVQTHVKRIIRLAIKQHGE